MEPVSNLSLQLAHCFFNEWALLLQEVLWVCSKREAVEVISEVIRWKGKDIRWFIGGGVGGGAHGVLGSGSGSWLRSMEIHPFIIPVGQMPMLVPQMY